jgi:hypothetical protein
MEHLRSVIEVIAFRPSLQAQLPKKTSSWAPDMKSLAAAAATDTRKDRSAPRRRVPLAHRRTPPWIR